MRRESGFGEWDRWASDVRVEDAARRRIAERWLRQQADEEGSFAGVLVDLGERRAPVVVHTSAGRVHRGRIVQVGADFVRITVSALGDVVVALFAVSCVRTLPGEPAVAGDRHVSSRITLAELLTALTAERDRATIVPADGSEPVCGVVRSVGRDVVVVRVEGDDHGRAATAYVPLSSIGEVVPDV